MSFFENVFKLNSSNIEHVYSQCENVLTTVLLKEKVNELNELISSKILIELISAKINKDHLNSNDDMTDCMIEIMFEAMENIIEKNYPDLKTNYHVNGYDSYFQVMDDNLFEFLSKAGIHPETIRTVFRSDLVNIVPLDNILQTIEIAENESLVIDIVAAIKHGSDFTVYESVEELGNDYSDSPLREEDDTDESFGLFLLQAYKDGNSGCNIYHQFRNGKILVTTY